MQYHWRMSMTFLKAFIFGTPEVFVGNAASKFDKTSLDLIDEGTKRRQGAACRLRDSSSR
jgi:chromate reductase